MARLVGHHDVQRLASPPPSTRRRFRCPSGGPIDDPAGDLAAIGDQNSFEHAWRPATFGRGPIFSTAYAVRPTTLSCFLVQKNQTAAKTFQQERTSRSFDMSPFSLHVTRRRGPFPLTAYDFAKPLQLRFARSGAPDKKRRATTRRFVDLVNSASLTCRGRERLEGAPAARLPRRSGWRPAPSTDDCCGVCHASGSQSIPALQC